MERRCFRKCSMKGIYIYIQGVHKVRVHFRKFITLFVLVIEKICKQDLKDLKVSCKQDLKVSYCNSSLQNL